MTRAMQYRMFWFRLAKMLESEMPLQRAMEIIRGQAVAGDVFDEYIGHMADNVVKGPEILCEYMIESGMFSTFEFEMVRAGYLAKNLAGVADWLARSTVGSRAAQYANFYRTFGLTRLAGVPIIKGLWISRQGMDGALQGSIEMIAEGIRRGDTLVVPMQDTGQFSPMEVNMIEIAEETGTLDTTLLQLADRCGPDRLLENYRGSY